MGSMKKFGYTTLDTEEGVPSKTAHLLHMHENYTCVLASSPAYAKDLAAGFHCDARIVKILPLPRTDLLRSPGYRKRKRAQILSEYPMLKKKRVIFTARPSASAKMRCRPRSHAWPAPLTQRRIFLCLSRTVVQNHRERPAHLCGTGFSSFDMLFVADAVISDYSCIVYEAAFMGIPFIFIISIWTNISVSAALAIDYYEEIPGPASSDPYALMDALHNQPYDMKRLKQFSDKYIRYSGHAGQDIAGYILSFFS